MAEVLLEVCVDSAEGLAAAVEGGADRIELCAALGVGGLTPSAGLMRQAAGCGVPVLAMIRPRAGDFCFGAADLAVMRADIAAAREAGLAGVVLGAMSGPALDRGMLGQLVTEAEGLDLTLHRCIDLCDDPAAALEEAITLGFRRVLSSGGAATAGEGAPVLARLMRQATGRIVVMPGSGISAETVGALAGLPLAEVHGSCSVATVESGFGFGAARLTDAGQVRALKAALR